VPRISHEELCRRTAKRVSRAHPHGRAHADDTAENCTFSDRVVGGGVMGGVCNCASVVWCIVSVRADGCNDQRNAIKR
jgi:hypothetical protein